MEPTYPSSFLDRLLPAALGATRCPIRLGRAEFLETLARDVEDLLNTSSVGSVPPPRSAECSNSILEYGLPDRAYFSGDPAEAARLIAATIAKFDTRLDQVRVGAIGPDPDRPGQVLVEIRARLTGQPRSSVSFLSRLGPDRTGVRCTLIAPGRDER